MSAIQELRNEERGLLKERLSPENREKLNDIYRKMDALYQEKMALEAAIEKDVAAESEILFPQRKQLWEQSRQAQDSKRENPYSPVSLMKKLFGHDFAAIAAEYGRKGTDTEILEEINKVWEEMKVQAGTQDTSQEFGLCAYEYSLLPKLTVPVKERFDNAQDIERIARDFIAGIRVSLSTKLAEEKAEAERVVQEKLKSDPRYKTVPAELMAQFKELGITVRANTQECYLPGFRGRSGTTHEPFSRWFLQDSKAKMGALFRMKDILKARYGASFTDRWDEFSGAWWHVASSVDLKELYQLLA